MRTPSLRRMIAVLFVIVGVGAASSALPAQAAPAGTHPVVQHTTVKPNDWNW